MRRALLSAAQEIVSKRLVENLNFVMSYKLF
jgi:hypothetical protein